MKNPLRALWRPPAPRRSATAEPTPNARPPAPKLPAPKLPAPRLPAQRPLTPGETALAASVFGTALDTRDVTVRGQAWWPLQPRNVVMAPCGHIHFHARCPFYHEDFSRAPLNLQGLLIHELTHVWQHQSGRNVIAARHPLARYRYLPLKPGKRFEHYGIEQQAEIVRHAFLLTHGEKVEGAPPLEVYKRLLPFGPDRRVI